MNSDNEADVAGTVARPSDGTAGGGAARRPRAAHPASSVTANATAVLLQKVRTS